MIRTARLVLVPATAGSLRAAIEGRGALAEALGVEVPDSWPHEFLDEEGLRFFLAVVEAAPDSADDWIYFVVHVPETGPRMLIGTAGFKGPPSSDGTVEIGYGLVRDRQRQGLGTEVVEGLLERAWTDRSVTRVIAETQPELGASIALLRKCGFQRQGEGAEPGSLRFERLRDVDSSRRA
jgi:RimJ/RimL family protein N-acetyltransferase